MKGVRVGFRCLAQELSELDKPAAVAPSFFFFFFFDAYFDTGVYKHLIFLRVLPTPTHDSRQLPSRQGELLKRRDITQGASNACYGT